MGHNLSVSSALSEGQTNPGMQFIFGTSQILPLLWEETRSKVCDLAKRCTCRVGSLYLSWDVVPLFIQLDTILTSLGISH